MSEQQHTEHVATPTGNPSSPCPWCGTSGAPELPQNIVRAVLAVLRAAHQQALLDHLDDLEPADVYKDDDRHAFHPGPAAEEWLESQMKDACLLTRTTNGQS